MDEQSTFSEGARRVLAAAQALAEACGARVVESRHLIRALWQDESRAAEILTRAGVAEEQLFALFPLPGDEHRARLGGSSTPGAAPPSGAELVGLSRRASRLARDTGNRAEVGTEHLLAAVLELDAHSARLLEEFDLNATLSGSISVEGLTEDDAALPLTTEPPVGRPPNPAESPTNRTPAGVALAGSAETVRILDAAANRCREGLRVVEDYVRFALNDGTITGQLKTFRHALVKIAGQLGADRFHRQRDTVGDVGTEVRTGIEPVRAAPLDVVRANCKRVEESLRTLEEFGKLVLPESAAEIEKLRYGFYTLERAVLTVADSQARLSGCRLYLLVTAELCRRRLDETVRGALLGGVNCVQLREKQTSDRQFIDMARRIREWTREAGALFIINDRPDLAVLVDADGVHVGQDDLPVREARRILGTERLIGVSTHSIEQARQAVLDGADYLGVGPVFPSGTKEFTQFPGLEFVRQTAADVGLPWFAIGGITVANVGTVVAAGARRVAVSGAVCGAEDAASAAQQLRAAMDT